MLQSFIEFRRKFRYKPIIAKLLATIVVWRYMLMYLIHKVWEDIKKGDNLDLYSIIPLAIILAVLSALGIAPANLIGSVGLLVLSLFTIALIKNRYTLEEILRSSQIKGSVTFLEKWPEELFTSAETVKELWLVGVTLTRHIEGKYGFYKKVVDNGGTLNVLMVHPKGAGLEIAAKRYFSPATRDPEQHARRIKENIKLISDLGHNSIGKVCIRTINYPFSFGAICVNPELNNGVLYLEHFHYQTIPDAQPKFVLHSSDGEWYEFFKKEITILWNDANDWNSDNP